MRRAALAIAIALTMTSAAAAQGTSPGAGAPGAAPSPEMSAPPRANPRRGGSAGQGALPASVSASCDQGSDADIRKCKAKNVAALQRALNRKIAESCQKQAGAGGPRRNPGAADERLSCRFDTMTRLMQSIN